MNATSSGQPGVDADEVSLGIIGAGHFARYTLTALRRGGFDGPITCSPRGAQAAADLRDRFGATIATDNAGVAASSGIVLISVRPQDFSSAVAGITFRDNQLVLSALAGVPLDRLRAEIKGSPSIVRIMPAAYVEQVPGLFPIHPANKRAETLLAHGGEILVCEDENTFDATMIAVCMNVWVYELMDEMIAWFIGKGIAPQAARKMVEANFGAAAAFSASRPEAPLEQIVREIATPGTYTAAGLDALRSKGMAPPWHDALETVYTRLKDG